jgi:MFS family permease
MLPASSPSSSGFHTLLRNRPFMTLWVGQLLSQLADKVFFVLLIALLVNYQAPTFQVGQFTWAIQPNSMRSSLMIAATLPAIFFGSAAGIFVDRYDKRAILSGCNFWRGVMLLLLPLPFVPKEFAILLAIAFLESVLTQFFAPAEQAAIPYLVKPDNLLTANALFTTTMMGSMIVGFAVGDPLLSLATRWNAEWGREIMVGGLYILAAGCLYLVPLKEPPKSELEQATQAVHPWSDFKAGLKYLKRDRLVSTAMLQMMILYSVLAALVILAIEMVKVLGLEETKFSFLLAAAGVGMVLGAAVLGHWGDRFHGKPLPLIGFLSMAFVLAMFAVIAANPGPNAIGIVLLLCGLLGLGGVMIGLPMQTLIQQQTPEAMRGKVFGFQNNVVNIALSLPLAIAGPLTDTFGLQAVLIGISITVAGVGVWAWRNTGKVLRKVI